MFWSKQTSPNNNQKQTREFATNISLKLRLPFYLYFIFNIFVGIQLGSCPIFFNSTFNLTNLNHVGAN